MTSRQAVAALRFTLLVSLATAAINAVTGTLIAWVLVRDRFRGKALVNALIDLPFALPTIVAGLTLLALYGPTSPLGINVAYTQTAVLMALLFVTLPFVVRSVQPVLIELDREMEEAAVSLGASQLDGVPPDRPAEPDAGGAVRRRARVRPRGRRVRVRRPDLRATSRSTPRSPRSSSSSRSRATTPAARRPCRSCCSGSRCGAAGDPGAGGRAMVVERRWRIGLRTLALGYLALLLLVAGRR